MFCPSEGRTRTLCQWAILFGTVCHGSSRTLSSRRCQLQQCDRQCCVHDQPWDHCMITHRMTIQEQVCVLGSCLHRPNCTLITLSEAPNSASTLCFMSTIDGSCSDSKMSPCSPVRTMFATHFTTGASWLPLFSMRSASVHLHLFTALHQRHM